MKFLQLVVFEDIQDQISLVNLSPDERLISFATGAPLRNIYITTFPIRTRRKKDLLTIVEHKADIRSLVWGLQLIHTGKPSETPLSSSSEIQKGDHTSRNQHPSAQPSYLLLLFSADDSGIVCKTQVSYNASSHSSSFVPSISTELLYQADSRVNQLSFETSTNQLMVSSATCTALLDFTRGQAFKIGTKPRQGPYGASFYLQFDGEMASIANNQSSTSTGSLTSLSTPIILSARPGSRIWVAKTDNPSKVTQTLNFQSSFQSTLPSFLFGSQCIFKDTKTSLEDVNFYKLVPFDNLALLTWNASTIFCVDIHNLKMLSWFYLGNKSFGNIIDIVTFHDNAYVLFQKYESLDATSSSMTGFGTHPTASAALSSSPSGSSNIPAAGVASHSSPVPHLAKLFIDWNAFLSSALLSQDWARSSLILQKYPITDNNLLKSIEAVLIKHAVDKKIATELGRLAHLQLDRNQRPLKQHQQPSQSSQSIQQGLHNQPQSSLSGSSNMNQTSIKSSEESVFSSAPSNVNNTNTSIVQPVNADWSSFTSRPSAAKMTSAGTVATTETTQIPANVPSGISSGETGEKSKDGEPIEPVVTLNNMSQPRGGTTQTQAQAPSISPSPLSENSAPTSPSISSSPSEIPLVDSAGSATAINDPTAEDPFDFGSSTAPVVADQQQQQQQLQTGKDSSNMIEDSALHSSQPSSTPTTSPITAPIPSNATLPLHAAVEESEIVTSASTRRKKKPKPVAIASPSAKPPSAILSSSPASSSPVPIALAGNVGTLTTTAHGSTAAISNPPSTISQASPSPSVSPSTQSRSSFLSSSLSALTSGSIKGTSGSNIHTQSPSGGATTTPQNSNLQTLLLSKSTSAPVEPHPINPTTSTAINSADTNAPASTASMPVPAAANNQTSSAVPSASPFQTSGPTGITMSPSHPPVLTPSASFNSSSASSKPLNDSDASLSSNESSKSGPAILGGGIASTVSSTTANAPSVTHHHQVTKTASGSNIPSTSLIPGKPGAPPGGSNMLSQSGNQPKVPLSTAELKQLGRDFKNKAKEGLKTLFGSSSSPSASSLPSSSPTQPSATNHSNISTSMVDHSTTRTDTHHSSEMINANNKAKASDTSSSSSSSTPALSSPQQFDAITRKTHERLQSYRTKSNGEDPITEGYIYPSLKLWLSYFVNSDLLATPSPISSTSSSSSHTTSIINYTITLISACFEFEIGIPAAGDIQPPQHQQEQEQAQAPEQMNHSYWNEADALTFYEQFNCLLRPSEILQYANAKRWPSMVARILKDLDDKYAIWKTLQDSSTNNISSDSGPQQSVPRLFTANFAERMEIEALINRQEHDKAIKKLTKLADPSLSLSFLPSLFTSSPSLVLSSCASQYPNITVDNVQSMMTQFSYDNKEHERSYYHALVKMHDVCKNDSKIATRWFELQLESRKATINDFPNVKIPRHLLFSISKSKQDEYDMDAEEESSMMPIPSRCDMKDGEDSALLEVISDIVSAIHVGFPSFAIKKAVALQLCVKHEFWKGALALMLSLGLYNDAAELALEIDDLHSFIHLQSAPSSAIPAAQWPRVIVKSALWSYYTEHFCVASASPTAPPAISIGHSMTKITSNYLLNLMSSVVGAYQTVELMSNPALLVSSVLPAVSKLDASVEQHFHCALDLFISKISSEIFQQLLLEGMKQEEKKTIVASSLKAFDQSLWAKRTSFFGPQVANVAFIEKAALGKKENPLADVPFFQKVETSRGVEWNPSFIISASQNASPASTAIAPSPPPSATASSIIAGSPGTERATEMKIPTKKRIDSLDSATTSDIATRPETVATYSPFFYGDHVAHWGVHLNLVSSSGSHQSAATCARCGLPLLDPRAGKVAIFERCTHPFHENCVEEDACPECLVSNFTSLLDLPTSPQPLLPTSSLFTM